MTLREFLYKLEGEIEGDPRECDLPIEIVDDLGGRYDVESFAGDGHKLIVSVKFRD
jgi:hypothetical protein